MSLYLRIQKVSWCLLVLVFLCGVTTSAQAYVPVLVQQHDLHDVTVISDPDLAQYFFGVLQSFPHTYAVESDVPFTLTLKLFSPDVPTHTDTLSSIIIKVPPRGRVEEVVRLEGREAHWDVLEETLSGADMRSGPTYERQLDAGQYRIEVHTPDNTSKYVLSVGTREEMTIGYFELLRRIARIEGFFERSVFWMVESSYVYVPLLLGLVFGSGIWLWVYRREDVHRVLSRFTRKW